MTLIKGGLIRSKSAVRGIVRQPPGGGGGTDYASYFTGGYTGFVYDGTESSIYTNSDGPAGVSPDIADADNDAVGYIEDLSGGGNNAFQSTSTAKPVLYVDGAGIKSWRLGKVTQGRWMSFTNSTTCPAQFTTIVVAAPVVFNNNNGAYFISNTFNNNWAGGTYQCWGAMVSAANNQAGLMDNGATWRTVSSNASISPKRGAIFLYERVGTGAGQWELTNYKMDGTSNATNSFAGTSTGTPDLYMGAYYGATVIDNSDVAFMFHINRNLTAQERTDLLATIVSKFSAWGPEV